METDRGERDNHTPLLAALPSRIGPPRPFAAEEQFNEEQLKSQSNGQVTGDTAKAAREEAHNDAETNVRAKIDKIARFEVDRLQTTSGRFGRRFPNIEKSFTRKEVGGPAGRGKAWCKGDNTTEERGGEN